LKNSISATEKTIDIPDIGLVTLKRSNRAKRVNIRLKPFGVVELVIPKTGSEKDAIGFLISKKKWIQKTIKKVAEKETKLSLFDENTTFKTRTFILKIEKQNRTNINLKLQNGVLLVSYPEAMPVTHPNVQDAIRYGIVEGLRVEAKSFLPGRIAWLASQYGFKHNKVSIKNLKSRWGSCSGVNNINLNLHLMRLPDELIDYVLLHELCHTVEKNHGKAFWRLLDRVTGSRARELDKMINQYSTRIY
jgi:predicted metal-dependent hydrolase